MNQENQVSQEANESPSNFDLQEFFKDSENEAEKVKEEKEESTPEPKKENKSNNKTTNTTTKKEVNIPKNNWTHTYQKEIIKINEFGQHEYQFHPVVYPDGTPSDRFIPFCLIKDETINPNKKWVACNYSLSNRYVVASLEAFINELNKDIELESPKIYSLPFSMSYMAHAKGKKLSTKVFDEEAMAFIFQLMTGIDSAEIKEVATIIKLMVSNKYDGSGSLSIDYVLNISGNINSQKWEFNDYFSLAEYRHRVVHAGKITKFELSIEDIEKRAHETQTRLKADNKDVDKFIESISSKMKKEDKQKLNSHWEQTPVELKNKLTALVLASYVLDKSFDYRSYMNIRSGIMKS